MRQQCGIHLATRQVAQPFGHDIGRGQGHDRLARNPRATPAGGDQTSRITQPRVGRGDRVGIHAELGGKVPHGGQGIACLELTVAQQSFDAACNVLCIASLYFVC